MTDEEKNPAAQTTDNADTAPEVDLRAEADKWKNEYLYMRAELENIRKQFIKERSELLKFGNERLVRDLLGVLDNVELALQTPPGSDQHQSFRQGVELTFQEFKNSLKKHGVQEIDSLGQNFDPTLHEALSSEPSNTAPAGSVLRVFKKAYKLHDKLVRPAQVVVASEKK